MKKDLMKKLCSIALAAVMMTGTAVSGGILFSQTTLPVYAASRTVTENGFECKNVGEFGFSIVKYTGTDTNVVIPETVGGRTVTGIHNNAFQGCSAVKSITIPKTITYIHTDAFNGCINLEKYEVANGNPIFASAGNCLVSKDKATLYRCPLGYRGKLTIPAGIKTIQICSFENCYRLTEVVIPNGVKTIEEYAFYNCKVLQRVSIGSTVRFADNSDLYTVFRKCPRLTDINYNASDNSYYSIDGVLFLHDQDENALVLYPQGRKGTYAVPEGTTNVGGFYECTGLTGITFPNTVTRIGDFYGCSGLTQLTLPKSLRVLGYEAFQNCTNLISVTVEAGAQLTDGFQGDATWNAFANCPNLQTLKLPKSVNAIEFDESNNIVTNSPNVTIYGKTGSYAEQYAKRYGIPFSTAVPKLKNNASLAQSTIKLGEAVQVLHEGIDGKGPYEYAVYYKKASSEKWTKAQGYSTKAVTTFTPKTAVKYDVKVLVKDSRGKIISKYLTVSVKK